MLYNNHGQGRRQGKIIKNREILSIISEVSETLALTNKPRQLTSMTLDTVSRELKADCCWIQLMNAGSDQLSLVASLGFSPDMKQGMNNMVKDHLFTNEIIGLGHNIVIPSLNRDGRYGIPFFTESGYKSLLAVPIMTYRVHGIMGIAYRSRIKISEEFTQLITVIANLLGMALHKSNVNMLRLPKNQPEGLPLIDAKPDSAPDVKPVSPEKKKALRKSFNDHKRNMKLFNESHR
jgi:signal transduction protein with GAF and PtsI domain